MPVIRPARPIAVWVAILAAGVWPLRAQEKPPEFPPGSDLTRLSLEELMNVEVVYAASKHIQKTSECRAQWELRRALARTDQRFAHDDASVRAHFDRRSPRGDLPSGCFSNQNWQEPLRTTSRVFRGKFLIPERLAPAGSSAAVRFPAPGSPGPPRSETSARGATLLPRELEMGSRLTAAPRERSRGFASKARVVRRVSALRVDAGRFPVGGTENGVPRSEGRTRLCRRSLTA